MAFPLRRSWRPFHPWFHKACDMIDEPVRIVAIMDAFGEARCNEVIIRATLSWRNRTDRKSVV